MIFIKLKKIHLNIHYFEEIKSNNSLNLENCFHKSREKQLIKLLSYHKIPKKLIKNSLS